MEKISIIGAGAWGTALAQGLALEGKDITLWVREEEVFESIQDNRINDIFLPGFPLEPSIYVTRSMAEAAERSDIIIIMVPAQYVRPTLESLRGSHIDGKAVVIGSKGIEIETGALLSEVAKEELPSAVCAVMTGPTFASEIAAGLPSAVTIACQDKDVAAELRNAIGCKHLRPYITDDMIGVQIGGALKNVLAIASGIIIGKGLGESARAALITRGIAEMGVLTSAMGGRKATLMGMCGFGDVLLTCTSLQSRNFSLGHELGKGTKLQDVLNSRHSVTEGVHTAKAALKIADKYAVDMPIAETVYACLHGDMSIEEAIESMLSRPFKKELGAKK